jgi:hypothetical protein
MKELSEYKEVEGISANTYAGKAAKAVKTKARGILGDDLLIFKLIDFVSFMLLNNKFANKGIFITDDNKEECYIKVIESGDESLITDLEKYIGLKDDIKAIETSKAEYQEIIKKLQLLPDQNDENAVNKIVEDYLRR